MAADGVVDEVSDVAVRLVAGAALRSRFYLWDWGEAIVVDGLWSVSSSFKIQPAAGFVRLLAERWITQRPDPWYPDHVGPGAALLNVWQETGDARFIAYARLLVAHLLQLPRGRRGTFFNRPDLPDRSQMAWVDSLYTDPAFLSLFGRLTCDDAVFDAAVDYVEGHLSVLQDEGGLIHHAYSEESGRPSGVHWLRGQGWAALGLLSCLENLPRDHPRYSLVLDRFQFLMSAVAKRALDSGGWPTVIDEDSYYVEASGSLMLAKAFIAGAQLGLLDVGSLETGLKSWRRFADTVDAEGFVRDVSGRTPPRQEATAYQRIPFGHYPWGQGAYLLAADEVSRLNAAGGGQA